MLKDINVDYHSIIVFYNNTTNYIKSTTPVIPASELRKTIKKTESKKQISPEEIASIYNFLFTYKQNNKISKNEHVKNVKTRLENIDKNICPRCNSNLVKRTGRYGTFWGCESYPKCKFIKK